MIVALKSKYGHTHLDRLRMSGTGDYIHALEEGLGDGDIQLSVDRRSQEIFWVDTAHAGISFTNFDGKRFFLKARFWSFN